MVNRHVYVRKVRQGSPPPLTAGDAAALSSLAAGLLLDPPPRPGTAGVGHVPGVLSLVSSCAHIGEGEVSTRFPLISD